MSGRLIVRIVNPPVGSTRWWMHIYDHMTHEGERRSSVLLPVGEPAVFDVPANWNPIGFWLIVGHPTGEPAPAPWFRTLHAALNIIPADPRFVDVPGMIAPGEYTWDCAAYGFVKPPVAVGVEWWYAGIVVAAIAGLVVLDRISGKKKRR